MYYYRAWHFAKLAGAHDVYQIVVFTTAVKEIKLLAHGSYRTTALLLTYSMFECHCAVRWVRLGEKK